MDMTGEYRIAAPRQKVWEALNDPEILKQCIPGCEEINKLSDTEMTAKVTAKVGPVKAKFGGKVTLSDLDPPNGYRISGEGSGGAAGFAKGGAQVRLADDGADTLLSYTVEAHVGGKLAQIGSRLIDATARKMADDFFARFAAIVGGPAPAEAAAPAPGVEAPAAAAPAAEAPSAVPPAAPVPPPPTATRPEAKRLPPMIWIPVLAAVVALLLYFFTSSGGSH
jgi:carbon monoxide dehydrogenase subunit G